MKGEWTVTPIEGVSIDYRWRGYHAELAWPYRTRRGEIMTVVEVTYHDVLVRSPVRINLYSSSALDSLTTALRRPKKEDDNDVARFVGELARNAIGWYRQGAGTKQVEPALTNGGNWLVYPVWPSTGATAVAAAPGSYKSWLAQGLALQLATGVEVLESNTRTPRTVMPVLYLDWESDETTFASRLWALCEGVGLEKKAWLAYKSMRVPLQDAALSVQEEIARGGYGAVVVDSMSASIGGGLIDDDVVNGFWDSVRFLGVPALVLAHKSAENIKARRERFFGSIMSEARIRFAWNAESPPHGDLVTWSVFKDNNMGRLRSRLAWRIHITSEGDHEDRRLTEIHLAGVSPSDPSGEVEMADTLVSRVEAVLMAGALTAGEIAQQLGTTAANVRKIISRHGDRFAKTGDGRWALAQEPLPEDDRPDPM